MAKVFPQPSSMIDPSRSDFNKIEENLRGFYNRVLEGKVSPDEAREVSQQLKMFKSELSGGAILQEDVDEFPILYNVYNSVNEEVKGTNRNPQDPSKDFLACMLGINGDLHGEEIYSGPTQFFFGKVDGTTYEQMGIPDKYAVLGGLEKGAGMLALVNTRGIIKSVKDCRYPEGSEIAVQNGGKIEQVVNSTIVAKEGAIIDSLENSEVIVLGDCTLVGKFHGRPCLIEYDSKNQIGNIKGLK